MEGYPHASSSNYNLNNLSDLNCGIEIEGAYGCQVPSFGESCLLANEEVRASNEVETTSFIVEEIETRLAIDKIVDDEHMAFALYCKYARAKGFSVRKGQGIYFRDGGLLQGNIFLCSCEGDKDYKSSKSKIPQYQKTSFRCGCTVKLKVARRKGGQWRVTRFQKEHNHELYPSDQTHLLRSARKLTDQQELLLNLMVQSKIPVTKAVAFLENIAQGRENVGFTMQDAFDCLYRTSRRTKIENEDATKLSQHFKDKWDADSNFFWEMEVDDENRLLNFFFRDYRCLIDYEHFGDVLSFDTTYRTNKYELVCAPFVGINHHNKNIMFGFAFMSDETESSFEWLFKTFLKSMRGKQSGIIFTDQCQAMMNAIETVFSCAHHQLCQWHINQNAPSHFGNLKGDSKFKNLWIKCMEYCDYEEEFELTWKQMMSFEISDPKWFNVMYNLRHKWATVFSNHIFSVGLLTTSRSEGTNSALKKVLGNKTSYLYDCVLGCEKLIDTWRANEKEQDTLCHHNKPTLFVPYNPLLKHASKVYTLNIFKLFEKELRDTMGFEQPQLLANEGSSLTLFKVKSYGEGSEVKIVDHTLKVFDVLSMQSIPEKYIKQRWTKDAKGRVFYEKSVLRGRSGNEGDTSYVNEMAFVNHVTKEVHDLALQGKFHMEMRDILIGCIESAKEKLNACFANMSLNNSALCDNLAPSEDNHHFDEVLVRDPVAAKARGITNIQRRHWDHKRKRGKGKAENLKRTVKGAKRKSQNSQIVHDGYLSQEATFVRQYQPFQFQMPLGTMSQMTPEVCGQLNSFGDDISQEPSKKDWILPK